MELIAVASTHPESGLMGTDASEAAQIRNWLHVCESEVGRATRQQTSLRVSDNRSSPL